MDSALLYPGGGRGPVSERLMGSTHLAKDIAAGPRPSPGNKEAET